MSIVVNIARTHMIHVPLTALLLASSQPSAPPPPPLRWSRVSVRHDRKPLLSNAHVEAHAGRLLAVLGPSGAGKTTLLHALAGTTPHHGRKRLEGDCEHDALEPSRVAMLAQSESFFGMLTVRETLALAAAQTVPATTTTYDTRACQPPFSAAEGFRFFAALARRLPAFHLHLSEDPQEIAAVLSRFFTAGVDRAG